MRWVVLACALIASTVCTRAAAAQSLVTVEQEDAGAMRAVLHDLCRRQVVVLGEASHADGHTQAFKVALIERLVTRCGFRAVVFEGSLYEFLGVARAKREGRATKAMVGNAIGGLWKFETEMQPLIGFLYDQSITGGVTLGGMDDQFGGLEQPFANDAMPGLLGEGLSSERRAACVEALHSRIYGQYEDAHPYAAADRAFLTGCVADMRAALDRETLVPTDRSERNAMLDGIGQVVARDALEPGMQVKDRDVAMYGALAHLAAGLPAATKIIVWTHNVHAAKNAAIRPEFGTASTFGTLLHQAWGARAFALGFSARGGAFRWSRKEDRPLPPPPADSLEQAVQPGGATAYLDAAALRAHGTVPAAVDFHTYRTAPWGEVFDGLVLFAEERPPHSMRVYPTP